MSAKILSNAPTELELAVANAFQELEKYPEFKTELKTLQFKSAREVCIQKSRLKIKRGITASEKTNQKRFHAILDNE